MTDIEFLLLHLLMCGTPGWDEPGETPEILEAQQKIWIYQISANNERFFRRGWKVRYMELNQC